MKKLILLLLFFQVVQGQDLNLILAVDPNASITEDALDILTEAELNFEKFYVKVGVEHFNMDLKYTDFHLAGGLNVKLGDFPKVRTYAGIRYGRIYREKLSKTPLYGVESGIDYKITDRFSLGLRGTLDFLREDLFQMLM